MTDENVLPDRVASEIAAVIARQNHSLLQTKKKKINKPTLSAKQKKRKEMAIERAMTRMDVQTEKIKFAKKRHQIVSKRRVRLATLIFRKTGRILKMICKRRFLWKRWERWMRSSQHYIHAVHVCITLLSIYVQQ